MRITARKESNICIQGEPCETDGAVPAQRPCVPTPSRPAPTLATVQTSSLSCSPTARTRGDRGRCPVMRAGGSPFRPFFFSGLGLPKSLPQPPLSSNPSRLFRGMTPTPTPPPVARRAVETPSGISLKERWRIQPWIESVFVEAARTQSA